MPSGAVGTWGGDNGAFYLRYAKWKRPSGIDLDGRFVFGLDNSITRDIRSAGRGRHRVDVETPCADEMRRVIVGGESRDRDAIATGCVCEHIVAEIDPDVRHIHRLSRVEEHEVAEL